MQTTNKVLAAFFALILTAALAAQSLYLHGLKVAERSLESYFLDVTSDQGGT